MGFQNFVAMACCKFVYSSITGMIGYGMAKAAVHQLTKSLAQEKNGLPNGACAVAILP